MNPDFDIDPKETHRIGIDTENETFIKYGKEIRVHDFVQAGREGTEIKEVMQKAGGLEQLKRFNKELPTADIEINLNMNPILANKIYKAGQVAQQRINMEKAYLEEIKKNENKKEEVKEGE